MYLDRLAEMRGGHFGGHIGNHTTEFELNSKWFNMSVTRVKWE